MSSTPLTDMVLEMAGAKATPDPSSAWWKAGDQAVYTGRHGVKGTRPTGMKYYGFWPGAILTVASVKGHHLIFKGDNNFDYDAAYFAPPCTSTAAREPAPPAPPPACAAEPFWLVWNPKSGTPTMRHGTREEAEQEALRLAGHHSGRFFVLEAETFFERPVPDVVRGQIVTSPYTEV